jgi:hypothetical protein
VPWRSQWSGRRELSSIRRFRMLCGPLLCPSRWCYCSWHSSQSGWAPSRGSTPQRSSRCPGREYQSPGKRVLRVGPSQSRRDSGSARTGGRGNEHSDEKSLYEPEVSLHPLGGQNQSGESETHQAR